MRRVAFVGCSVLLVVLCSVVSAQQPSAAPVHPFKKRLYDQIGAFWYHAVAKSKNIPVGTVRVAMTISPNGAIAKLRVLSNTSNQVFAKLCLDAIHQAKIPPIPADLLSDGKFQDEIAFTVYENKKT